MTVPKISIIMPVKNRQKEIVEAIRSVIDQTFQDWELLVIDDRSTDKTAQVVKTFENPRIKYFYLAKGTGPGAGRDFGIRKAQGEIIVLADSDDINYPERLSLTDDYFQRNPDLDIVYGRSERLEVKTGKISSRPTCDFDRILLKAYNFISNVTAAFKKEPYLKTSGYDQKIKTSEDYDLWLTFLEAGFHFGFIDKSLVLQKIHPESLTSKTDFKERKKNLAYVRQKHHLAVPKPEQVKKLVDQELWNFIFTPRGKEFWFGLKS